MYRDILKTIVGGVVLAGAVLTGGGAAWALEAGDILVRFRGIGIIPTDESGGIRPDLLTSNVRAQPMGVPELDFTYMVTDNIGIELIAAVSPHDLRAEGAARGLGVDDAASLWLLPPTLLVQYHFLPDQKIRPYVGAGINVTFTFGEDADGSYEAVLGKTSVSATNSVGWAVQAGVDYELNDRWFLNFDVKYIAISVDANLRTGATKRQTKVDINPIIVGVGLGYRF